MNPGSPELERLISRYLDGEATAAERRALRAQMRLDPAVEALVDEYATLDGEIGRALRRAMGHPLGVAARRSPWSRLGQFAALAAAACLAAFVWLHTPSGTAPTDSGQPARAAASWFAPAHPQADILAGVDRSHEQPQIQLRDTDRDWIIVPGERAGEFLVIEVKRVRTHAVKIQDDF